MVLRNTKLQEKITELNGIIEEMKSSGPGGLKHEGGEGGGGEKNWKSDLKETLNK
jgi:hypothetical protein